MGEGAKYVFEVYDFGHCSYVSLPQTYPVATSLWLPSANVCFARYSEGGCCSEHKSKRVLGRWCRRVLLLCRGHEVPPCPSSGDKASPILSSYVTAFRNVVCTYICISIV